MNERRSESAGRRAADRIIEEVTNGWKENQKLVIQSLSDLKNGQTKLEEKMEERHKELRAERNKTIDEIKQAVHQAPCSDLKSLEAGIKTGTKVTLLFITPLVVAIISGIIVLLFEVFKKGGLP